MSHAASGFRSIVFDCDSTLAAIEGIDELAGPHAAEIRALTDAAMAGEIPLEQVYGRRLALIRPTRAAVESLTETYVRALVEDADQVVRALLWLCKEVRIISGGLLPPVVGIARHLGLDANAVAAVRIRFTGDGEYAGFDEESPLGRSGGKARQLEAWGLPRPVLLVGDGATDAEARPAVDAFAAYMGVVFREPVAAGAEFVLRDRSLAPVLPLSADPEDHRRLRDSPFSALLARGEALLAAADGDSIDLHSTARSHPDR
jgi:phosphoserine phosphatase